MKLSTCKGEVSGSVRTCARWLELIQPSMVGVVVDDCEAEIDSSDAAAGCTDESGSWIDGCALRNLLLEAERQASEAAKHEAAARELAR